MKTYKTTIVDYGVGNLFSVYQAFSKATDSQVVVSGDQDEICNSDFIVLPGVGAFGKAIQQLKKNKLLSLINDLAKNGKPIFGICLGMQLFASRSYEFGEFEGLDLIPGNVQKISSELEIKIPFIGWSEIEITDHTDEEINLIKCFDSKSMYTVHSYQFIAENKSHEIGHYHYGGNKITSIVKKDNVLGVQFHPEKSGYAGLSFINSIFNLMTDQNL